MRLTIKSKVLNETFEFFMPGSAGYVWREYSNRPGVLGQQLCRNGHYAGDCLSATADTFKQRCRAWYRQHVKKYR